MIDSAEAEIGTRALVREACAVKGTVIAFLVLTPLFPNMSHVQEDTPWWNNAVFYEIFVRSFYDSDDDGIGDLRGLIQKLDYLNDGDPSTTTDLGISGIWLMPVTQSPSYHGYDVTDYRRIEEDYGTLNNFTTLIDSAHARGIKVIIDLVLNHTSEKHPWFEESASSSDSPFRDWYIWAQQDPGYKGPWGQQVWHYRNGAYYFGLFWSGMPDLNYWTEEVQSEMFDVANFWLDTVKVDGFRLDAIKHLFENGPVMEDVPETLDFLEEFRQFYKNVNSEAVTVGEVWSPTNEIALYSDGTKVDFCFEFSLSYAIISAVKNRRPTSIVQKMEEVINSYPFLQYAPFLTNHDQTRVFEELFEDLDRMKLAAAVYLTLPGIPFIYYGEEIGMIGSGWDQNKRTPMQWTDGLHAGFSSGAPWYSINSNYTDFNVKDMRNDENSLWHWYRKLVSIRNESEALRLGDYIALSSDISSLYGYARSTENGMVIVLHNFHENALASPGITLAESDLHPGEYHLTDLITQESAGSINIDENGGFVAWHPEMELASEGTAILGIEPPSVHVEDMGYNDDPIPQGIELVQNFPNPFNPATVVQFDISESVDVSLTICDLLGREITVLVSRRMEPGHHQVVWNGKDATGRELPAGIYIAHMVTPGLAKSVKVILLR